MAIFNLIIYPLGHSHYKLSMSKVLSFSCSETLMEHISFCVPQNGMATDSGDLDEQPIWSNNAVFSGRKN